MPIQSSYTTASVSGDTAGGFVGKHAGGIISCCYAVGLVVDTTPTTTPSGAFVGNNISSLSGRDNRYFELINGNMPPVAGTGRADPTFAQSAETNLQTYNAFVQVGSSGEFFPFDQTLRNMFKTNYYLPKASEIEGHDVGAPTTHIGDWQPVDTLVVNTPGA